MQFLDFKSRTGKPKFQFPDMRSLGSSTKIYSITRYISTVGEVFTYLEITEHPYAPWDTNTYTVERPAVHRVVSNVGRLVALHLAGRTVDQTSWNQLGPKENVTQTGTMWDYNNNYM